jgi:hypothetical protein
MVVILFKKRIRKTWIPAGVYSESVEEREDDRKLKNSSFLWRLWPKNDTMNLSGNKSAKIYVIPTWIVKKSLK